MPQLLCGSREDENVVLLYKIHGELMQLVVLKGGDDCKECPQHLPARGAEHKRASNR